MRPVFLLLAGAFGLMLIGFPVGMYLLGLDTTGIVWVTVLILAVTVGILGFVRYLAREYEMDETGLAAGDAWAEWTVPENQYRRFLASERRGTRRRALAYALGGIVLGVGLAALDDDWLLGGVIITAFLAAALVIFTLGGPPRAAQSDDVRRVLIGPHGVQALGRYLPLEAPFTQVRAIDVAPGDLPTMRFSVKAGRRTDEIRVPVPPDRVREAEALAERFRREYEL